MNPDEPGPPAELRAGRTRRRPGRLLLAGFGLLTAYLLTAYVVVPLIWRTDLKRHPGLSGGPRVTHTAIGTTGNPWHTGGRLGVTVLKSRAPAPSAGTNAPVNR